MSNLMYVWNVLPPQQQAALVGMFGNGQLRVPQAFFMPEAAAPAVSTALPKVKAESGAFLPFKRTQLHHTSSHSAFTPVCKTEAPSQDDVTTTASPMQASSKQADTAGDSDARYGHHICAHCLETFSTRFSLKRHQKKHTGERPFKCKFQSCGRAFAEKSTLKRHMRTHTGEKPFRCVHPGCEKTFADRTNVRRHLLTHGPSAIFKEESALAGQTLLSLKSGSEDTSSADEKDRSQSPSKSN